ncbi:MAG: ABC transporter ATP-binding protein [Deltaproteobacteria bacterium]|nr:ABC transporter ATP-binding protein [Deltaproteobacteria bacterium]
MLNVKEIDTYYDIFQAIFKVSLQVQKKEVVCLLGRNGAGKTTTLSSIIGLTRPRSGSVQFKGREIGGQKSYQIVQMGIGFVPEHRWIFSDLTVRENLELGWREKKPKTMFEEIYQLFPKLKDLGGQKGGNLSGGEQQMLTIARTLMGGPELLLLDEPTAGLAPVIVQSLASKIRELKEKGVTILLAEQNAEFALGVSDRVYAIDKGSIVYEGTADHLKANGALMQQYLGVC